MAGVREGGGVVRGEAGELGAVVRVDGANYEGVVAGEGGGVREGGGEGGGGGA